MTDAIEQQLKLLELKCRWPVEHLLAGAYRSVFKGKGIEFEDVRAYQPGDDVRSMDWKVTARTGVPHIKRFIEEREQYIYLLVDVSASMLHDHTGMQRKTIVEICSLVTLSAIKNQDRVGLILFSEEIEHIVPPGKGRSHALRIMDTLMHFKPRGRKTDVSGALHSLEHIAHRRSIAFIVSDFFTREYTLEMQACARRHNLNAICIRRPTDRLSAPALIRMQDSETGEQRIIDLSADSNSERAYSLKQIIAEFIGSGVSPLNLTVGENCVEALIRFFHERQNVYGAKTVF